MSDNSSPDDTETTGVAHPINIDGEITPSPVASKGNWDVPTEKTITTQPTNFKIAGDSSLREQIEALPVRISVHSKGLNIYLTKDTIDDIMSLITTYIEAAQQQKLDDYIKQNPLELPMLVGMLMYNFTMEDTNANKVTFTLDGFNKKGKVLGDLTITAKLQAQKAVLESK